MNTILHIDGEQVDLHGLNYSFVSSVALGVDEHSDAHRIPTGHQALCVAIIADGRHVEIDDIKLTIDGVTMKRHAHDLHVESWYSPELQATHIFMMTIDPEVVRGVA